jgi:hypothetical protein
MLDQLMLLGWKNWKKIFPQHSKIKIGVAELGYDETAKEQEAGRKRFKTKVLLFSYLKSATQKIDLVLVWLKKGGEYPSFFITLEMIWRIRLWRSHLWRLVCSLKIQMTDD